MHVDSGNSGAKSRIVATTPGAKQRNRAAQGVVALALYDADANCRTALKKGFEDTGMVSVLHEGEHGQHALEACQRQRPDAVWLDCKLCGEATAIDIALQLRERHAELPVIIFALCDHEASLFSIGQHGLLTHYAFLSKTTYRLPEQFVETIREVQAGRAIVDPAIARWQHTVQQRERNSPLRLLSPIEQDVVTRLALGMTNKDIARDLGFKDGRAVSRINGAIYAAWGVPVSGAVEKVARTRATLIYLHDTLLTWDESGKPVEVRAAVKLQSKR